MKLSHTFCHRIFVAIALTLFATSAMAIDEDKINEQLRVLSFNIHAGKGSDGKLDLQRTAEVIKSAEPDLVALQEVDIGTRRSGKVDQAQTLADMCDMVSVFGKAIDYQGGEYGNAVLSTRKIIATNQIELSKKGAEKRSAVGIAIKLKNKQTVTLISTHWDHRSQEARSEAAGKLAAIVRRSKGVVLIAGDLNCELDSPEMSTLRKRVVAPNKQPVTTFPATTPTKQIDFLLIDKKAKWKLKSIESIDPQGTSDHRPLLAVFEVVK